MLKITSEGRKPPWICACSTRAPPTTRNSKISLAADRIFNLWRKPPSGRASARYLPTCPHPSENCGRQFSAYEGLKRKTHSIRCIPADQIAFMSIFDSDVQKHVLFKEVSGGEKSVCSWQHAKDGPGMKTSGTPLIALASSERSLGRPADVTATEDRILPTGPIKINQLLPDLLPRLPALTEGTLWLTPYNVANRVAKPKPESFIHQVSMTGVINTDTPPHIEDI